MRIIKVGRHLSLFRVLIHTEEFWWEGKAINAGTVGRPSCINRPLRNTWKFTRERSPTHVRIVGKPSDISYTLINIWEITTWRPLNVQNVGKASTSPQSLRNMLGFTLERNPINVRNVWKPSISPQSLRNILGFTLERNPINVKECGESYTNSSSLKTHLKRVCGWKEWGEAFIHFRKVLSAEGGHGGRELSEWTKMEMSSLNSQILQKCKISHFSFFKGNMGKPSVSQMYSSCKDTLEDFPGSPVGKTPPSHWRGLIPGGAANIPHAM